MRKTPCRLIAAILAAAMLIGLLPVSAMADYAPEIITFSGAEAKTCTFGETGIYHIYAYGKGGAGGDSVEFYHDDDFYGPSGGGGGSGGVCGHEAAFAAGDTLTVKFDGETLTVSGDGILLTCGSGEDGDSAYYNSDISYGAGIGGRAGTANGGNLINKSVGGEGGKSISNSLGNPGGSGGVVDSPYAEYGYGKGGNGGDGVQPGSQRQYGESGGSPAVIIEYISPAPAVMAMSLSEPSTLAEHSIGTVFKLSEDGTLYDWILISHNYEGTGNQLLMRKNCISYATGIVDVSYHSDADDTYYTLMPYFAGSPLNTYLNGDYKSKFISLLQQKMVNVSIETYKSYPSQQTINTNIFILSENEVFGSTSELGSRSTGNIATGSFIDYFTTAAIRKSDQIYMLRDGEYTTDQDWPDCYGGSTVSKTGTRSAGVASGGQSGWRSSTNYYRPCIVLPADMPATAGAEITGEVIPTIESVTVPDTWAKSSTATVNATNANAYALTSGNTKPSSGWQQSSSFKINANGKYYAWVKSVTDNTASKQFTVSKVDSSLPEISSVSEQDEYRQISSITVTASDAESGISGYALSATNDSSTVTWQYENTFEVTQNGLYYIFVKDNVGHISSCEYTAVMVDREPPIIESVSEQDEYRQISSITVTASDAESGISGYAISMENDSSAVTWKAENTFEVTQNGLYYIFVKDNVGHISSCEYTAVMVDREPPVIESVSEQDEYHQISSITVTASDAESGISGYAISVENDSSALTWQSENILEVTQNGLYYIFVKDNAGNIYSCEYTAAMVDREPPVIESVSEQDEYRQISSITVTASDAKSGISGYAFSSANDSSAVTWQAENIFEVTQNGLYYIFVKDNVGHISSCEYTAVMVDREPPVIESVRFEQDNTVMTVTAADTASGVKSITIDGTEYTGSTAVHYIADGLRYIDISAEDHAGNVSDTDALRIPGWFDILNTISIDSVKMVDKDNRILEITASSTVDPVFGILIDGVLHAGNPVRYTVPAGEKLLELQAQDINGDRSEIYTHYVVGFEEEISSLTVLSMRFNSSYSSVEITAAETGSAAAIRGIKGIWANGEFLPGNPVDYSIPAGTTEVTALAVNNDGDYSAPMTKQVPKKQTGGGNGGGSGSGEGSGDNSNSEHYSTPQLTIHQPAWTSAKTSKVYIEAKDDYGIRTIMAKTDKNGKWADITNDPYVMIDKDSVVYAYAVNWGGLRVDAQKDISCFDLEPPEVSTELHDDVLIIFAADDLSGIAGIYVNGTWHKGAEIAGGFYRYDIPDSVTSVSVMALDAAGNISGAVTVPVPAKPLPQPPAAIIEEPESETPPPAAEPAEPEPVVTLTPQPPPEMTEPEENPPRLASMLKVIVIVAVMILLAIAAAMAWAFILQRQNKDSEQETEDDAALDVSADPPDDEEPKQDEYEVLEVIEQDSEPQAIDFESSPLGARFKSFKGDD